jgi:poly(hydroxyalkanoate) depolymerase family esterase
LNNSALQRLMSEATRLTRSGGLRAATALIQKALGAHPVAPPAPAAAPANEAAFIDVQAREVPADADARADTDAQRGTFTSGAYAHASAGSRDYKLYLPPAAAGSPTPVVQPLPLLLMLHGCKQDPDDFALGTRMNAAANEHGIAVLYPAQSKTANPGRCWNWFKHNHQQRERGEPALLAGMTREVMMRHAIDPSRVYVAGLSAGGAMAAILGQAYPELFAAVGVHSGLPAGAAHDLESALQAMRSGPSGTEPRAGTMPPTIVFHGDLDITVNPANGDCIVRAASADAKTADAVRAQGNGGRAYTRRSYQDAAGRVVVEYWLVHGAGHAWCGGNASGSYADAQGPDATREMLRFFLEWRT